jgi:galactokinase
VTGGLLEATPATSLASLCDAASLAACHAAPRGHKLIAAAARALAQSGGAGGRNAWAFFVPGRIEVLGKHTDYAGGRSLLAATERGFAVVATEAAGDDVVFTDARARASVAFRMDPALEPVHGWPTYPMTVARRITRNFTGPLRGARVAFASNLPQAEGLSSSSALLTASFLALAAVNRLSADDAFQRHIDSTEALACYLACIENGAPFGELAGDAGVGTRGGAQDHTAILCARPGALSQYRFRPLSFDGAVPVPARHVFAVACSGVRAEKAGAARARYNRAAGLARIAAELWRRATGRADATLGAALASDPGAGSRLRALLAKERHAEARPDELCARVDQFVAESEEIVPAAAAALAAGDLGAFGSLVDRSQALAASHLRNQLPETEYLACTARELGAAAASSFGAGFGGSVWALVRERGHTHFLREWRARYAARFPGRADACDFFTTTAAGAAARIA